MENNHPILNWAFNFNFYQKIACISDAKDKEWLTKEAQLTTEELRKSIQNRQKAVERGNAKVGMAPSQILKN